MTTISSTSSTGSTSSSSSGSTTSSNSATSALLTAIGAGGGIDVTGLADQLSQAEYASRIDQIHTRQSALNSQISAASRLMNLMSSLTSSLNTRLSQGDLAATPSIANSAVATVTAGTATGSGTSTLEVTALAKGQTLTSPTLGSSSATIGSGTLSISFGTLSGTNFTADSARSAVSITIAKGATLADVATAINQSGAGLSAYVATNTDGAQLVIKGPQGANNAFTISASEAADDPGLSQLAWTPTSGSGNLAARAGDASFVLDGVTRTSHSNTIVDAAPGISLKLTGTNAGNPTTIGFSDPTSTIAAAMNDLVSALNQVTTELNTDIAVGGSLNNNSAARSLQSSLQTLSSTTIMPHAAAGEPATLADLGVGLAKDGTFTLDTARLNSVLAAKPSAVAAMFTTGLYGIYSTIYKVSQSATASTSTTSLAKSISTLTAQGNTLTTQLSTIATQQAALRTDLISRFSALNTTVAASKSTQSFLTQQVALWTKSSG